jgi:hypothetical protein
MFNFFKKKTDAKLPIAIPLLIAGRKGHVGGIESLILDDVVYYFGFDYQSDLVLSPLIGNAEQMAHFAAEHMLQRDGAHDVAYWRELVGYASDESELCSDIEGRTFSSNALLSMMALLQQVEKNNTPAPSFKLAYHLRYLLGAAGGWLADGDEFDNADDYVAVIRGDNDAAQAAGSISPAEAAKKLRMHLSALLDAAPENWSTLFGMLRVS